MVTPNRRTNDMAAAEAAYRKGLRRRTSDVSERLAYFGMLIFISIVLLFLGVLSWLSR